MESRYDWEQIRVPDDWNAEEDLAKFVARFGESDNYFRDAKQRVEKGLQELNESLERGLRYYGSPELTMEEKIAKFTLLTNALQGTGSKEALPEADTVEELARLLNDLQVGIKPPAVLGKICRLEAVVRAGLKPEAYRQGAQTPEFLDRLEEDFRYCRFILTEYERVTSRDDSRLEDAWLIQLVRLADRLEFATDGLEESLLLEHLDYEKRMGDPSWLREVE